MERREPDDDEEGGATSLQSLNGMCDVRVRADFAVREGVFVRTRTDNWKRET